MHRVILSLCVLLLLLLLLCGPVVSVTGQATFYDEPTHGPTDAPTEEPAPAIEPWLTPTGTTTPTTTTTTTTTAPTAPTAVLPTYNPDYPYTPTTIPTTTPTGTGTGTGTGDSGVPDRGTYWPWNTRRGVLPDTIYSYDVNPSAETYYYHIIWLTSKWTEFPAYPMGGTIMDTYIDVSSNHTYGHARFTYLSDANTFFMTLSSSGNSHVITIGSGSIYSVSTSLRVGTQVYPRLLLRYSYLITNYRIPSSIEPSSYSSYTYYLTARSSRGEFRMITYYNVNDMIQAFQTITTQYIYQYNQNNTSPKQRYWDTVKVYYQGDVFWADSVCRGSELEHQGAFQWLTIPVSWYRYSSPYSYYLLVSYTSLSGVPLERMHVFQDYDSAAQTQQWLQWYTSTYDRYWSRASSLIYHNQVVWSSNIQPGFDVTSLQRHFYWITGTTITTSYPTAYPTPIVPREPATYATTQLTTREKTFIIAYTTSLIVVSLVIVLIVGRCVKRRDDNNVFGSAGSVHCRVKCLMVLLSVSSLILLIVSISLKRFSNIKIVNAIATFGSYGPFQVDQYYARSDSYGLRQAAQIISPITGVCMIISMIASLLFIIQIIRHHLLSYRMLLLSLIASLFSLCATLIWIPFHVRLQQYRYSSQFDPDQYPMLLVRFIGTGYILLICATAIHVSMLMACIIIHKKYRNHTTTASTTTSTSQSDQELEGLQYVSPTSPYYYRDVPSSDNPSSTVMAVPVPAYIYGVPRPTAPPTAPPPFVFAAVPASGYPYAAPMYHPPAPAAAPVAEPLHQPISVPAPYTVPAVPTAYPSIPVDVPASGPNMRYQRLI